MELAIDRPKTPTVPPESDTLSLIYKVCSGANYENNAGNELTWENLQKLSEFSKTIESPSIFGKFNNEQHYLDTLHLVLSSTHETRNRVLFCLNEILPQVPFKGSLLDVGPGNGALTKILAQHFKNITMIDINHHGLDQLQKSLPSSIKTTSITGSILDVDVESEYYNLVVLSHMLYYIEPHLWLDIIKSTYRSLKEDGIIIIILGGDEQGKSDLIQTFGGQILAIDPLAIQCQNIFGRYRVQLYASDESFVTCTHEAMLHIAGFMLADANINASEDDLNSYITQKLKHSDNHYEMTTRQKYIIINKKSRLMDDPHDYKVIFAKN